MKFRLAPNITLPESAFLDYNRFMPAQYQESPRSDQFLEEETGQAQKPSAKKNRKTAGSDKKKPFQMTAGKGILIGAICLSCLAGGAALRNTTLFLEHRSVDQYLPVEEYVLKDQETGNYTQNIRSLDLKNEYVYSSRSSYKMTSRGIKVGDSWNDFMNAYGDIHADSIYVHRVGEDGYVSYSNEDSLYIGESILLNEFQKQYIDTGKVDPDRDEITVVFRVDTDGFRLFYNESELDRVYDEYFQHPLRHPFRSYPDFKTFTLDLTFRPGTYYDVDSSGLEYISNYFE